MCDDEVVALVFRPTTAALELPAPGTVARLAPGSRVDEGAAEAEDGSAASAAKIADSESFCEPR